MTLIGTELANFKTLKAKKVPKNIFDFFLQISTFQVSTSKHSERENSWGSILNIERMIFIGHLNFIVKLGPTMNRFFCFNDVNWRSETNPDLLFKLLNSREETKIRGLRRFVESDT